MSQTEVEAADARRIGMARAAIGLVQGLALYGLVRLEDAEAWPSTDPLLFNPLVVVWLAIPLLLLTGVGSLRKRTLIAWPVVATVVVALLAWHDLARRVIEAGRDEPTFPLFFVTASFLFIAHHLVAAADQDRRPIAAYPTYFDLAWKHGVQLVLSIGFTGIFWGLLFLGASLFRLIGVTLFADIIGKAWFALPATTLMFAFAVHVTDVRPALIRGARTIALALLAWLTPLMALIGAGFLVALPFTGLDPLWGTRSAVSILLAATAALIILTNAAFQDGEADVPAALRWGGRVAAVLPAPFIAIAAYGLALRVGQHGWTPERVIAAACVVVGAAYAAGYAFAAVRRGRWLAPMERTNVAVALLVLAVLLALFTPLADPARLSVNSQVRRLEAGRITPAKFDYAFLKFDAVKYGRRALDRLKVDKDPAVAKAAAEADKRDNRHDPAPVPAPGDLARRIKVYPPGRALPPGFLAQDWSDEAANLPGNCRAAGGCEAFFVDLDGDGDDEVLMTAQTAQMELFEAKAGGGWRRAGAVSPGFCPGVVDALRAGAYRTAPSRWKSLEIAGQSLRVNERDGCAEAEAPRR